MASAKASSTFLAASHRFSSPSSWPSSSEGSQTGASLLQGSSLTLSLTSGCWLSWPGLKNENHGNIPYFGDGVILYLASIPIILLDIGVSLATKLVKDEVQGFAAEMWRLFGKYVTMGILVTFQPCPIVGSSMGKWISSVVLHLILHASDTTLGGRSHFHPVLQGHGSKLRSGYSRSLSNDG